MSPEERLAIRTEVDLAVRFLRIAEVAEAVEVLTDLLNVELAGPIPPVEESPDA